MYPTDTEEQHPLGKARRAASNPGQIIVVKERRSNHRRPLYLGEGFTVQISWKEEQFYSGECICLSLDGMAVAFPLDSGVRDLKSDTEVTLLFELPGYSPLKLQAVVAYVIETSLTDRKMLRVGLYYVNDKRGPFQTTNTRRSIRIQCPEFFSPLAFGEHPLFFKEHLHFKVRVIGLHGLELETSARNKGLLLGLPLRLTLLVPLQGEFVCEAAVRNVRERDEGSNRIVVGVEFIRKPESLIVALSEYLIAATGIPPRVLRESQFLVEGMGKALGFHYPNSPSDWEEILELRFRAYKAAGKFVSAKTPADMTDTYDHHARHIICKVSGRVIGCIRVVFVNGDVTRSEHYNLGLKIPKFLGTHFVEISRACTDTDYRGTDLLINMTAHAARVVHQSGYRYVLFNCNENMWPLYKKSGARDTGITFDAFGTNGCKLVYYDMTRVLAGGSANPVFWHHALYPMTMFLQARTPITGVLNQISVHFHKLIHPIIKVLLKVMLRRRARALAGRKLKSNPWMRS